MGYRIENYEKASEIEHIIRLIQTELSEPYSIYTYRYFLFNWSHLCIFARMEDLYIGVLVAKLEPHKQTNNNLTEVMESSVNRGYIAMLSVELRYRKLGIGKALVKNILAKFRDLKADEVILETECLNDSAIKLYTSMGFIIDKKIENYYYNRKDAYRLKYFL